MAIINELQVLADIPLQLILVRLAVYEPWFPLNPHTHYLLLKSLDLENQAHSVIQKVNIALVQEILKSRDYLNTLVKGIQPMGNPKVLNDEQLLACSPHVVLDHLAKVGGVEQLMEPCEQGMKVLGFKSGFLIPPANGLDQVVLVDDLGQHQLTTIAEVHLSNQSPSRDRLVRF